MRKRNVLWMMMLSLALAAGGCKSDEANPAADKPSAAKPEPKPEPKPPAPAPAAGTIPEVAAAAGSFKTLLAAVEAAGLVETLAGAGPFTPGKVMAKAVGGLTSAKTVQGADLAIDTSSGVKVGGATVVKADIEASNGVIHVIDAVLMPPM